MEHQITCIPVPLTRTITNGSESLVGMNKLQESVALIHSSGPIPCVKDMMVTLTCIILGVMIRPVTFSTVSGSITK